jgi:hypothetical protein
MRERDGGEREGWWQTTASSMLRTPICPSLVRPLNPPHTNLASHNPRPMSPLTLLPSPSPPISLTPFFVSLPSLPLSFSHPLYHSTVGFSFHCFSFPIPYRAKGESGAERMGLGRETPFPSAPPLRGPSEKSGRKERRERARMSDRGRGTLTENMRNDA